MTLSSVLSSPLGSPLRTAIGEGVGGYTFTNAEASALVARFTTPPTSARKVLIDTLVGSLKTAGVWTKLDALYLFAAADAQSARQNWIQDLYNATAVSSPTFTADRGYAGDGSASYLDSGFGPSVAASPKFVQNSASFGVWSLTAGISANQQLAGNNSSVILPSNAGTATIRVNNAGTASTGANVSSDGFFLANRSGAAAETLRRNKTGIISATPASAVVDNSTHAFGKRTGTFATHQMAAGFIGQSLSTGESDAFYDAALVYLQAVGAA